MKTRKSRSKKPLVKRDDEVDLAPEGQIGPERMRELEERVRRSWPRTDPEVRALVASERKRQGRPPLTDAEMTKEIAMVNHGACMMFRSTDPNMPAAVGARIAYVREQARHGPKTKPESDFVMQGHLLQTRERMHQEAEQTTKERTRAKRLERPAKAGKKMFNAQAQRRAEYIRQRHAEWAKWQQWIDDQRRTHAWNLPFAQRRAVEHFSPVSLKSIRRRTTNTAKKAGQAD